MARVTYGSLVTELNGSVGGTTFQRNAYGFTAKNKPNMLRPWTDYQKKMQLCMSRAIHAWSTIAATERVFWNTFASSNPQYSKHNPSSILSGYAIFVKWHFYHFLSDVDIVVSPNSPIPSVPTVILSFFWNGSECTIYQNVIGSSGQWDLYYFLSPPLPPTVNFYGTKTRYVIKSESFTDYIYADLSYYNMFGQHFTTGQRIAVSFFMVDAAGGRVLPAQSTILVVPNL